MIEEFEDFWENSGISLLDKDVCAEAVWNHQQEKIDRLEEIIAQKDKEWVM